MSKFWWNETPMSAATREKLLATQVASARTALATILSNHPGLSYNACLKALKQAPKGNSEQGEYFLGQEAARRLLGKVGG